MLRLIDTHSHIYEPEFDDDRNEVVECAIAAGVDRMLLPAIDTQSHSRMIELTKAHPANCFAMMGLHPTSVNENPTWRNELAEVEEYLRQPPEGVRFYAVGEIGLDYYWSQDYVAEQREAFVEQCRLAARLDLPVAIHTRAAWDDMCSLLEQECRRAEEREERLRGVLHAYSEDAATYRRLKECGDWLFGVGGVVTYKKSLLAEAVKEMALEDIVLETDCPYLAPHPLRGTLNHSGNLRYTNAVLASIFEISEEECAALTEENARRFFSI